MTDQTAITIFWCASCERGWPEDPTGEIMFPREQVKRGHWADDECRDFCQEPIVEMRAIPVSALESLKG